MALIYRAQLTPSKLDLLRAWAPDQLWLGGADPSQLEMVGAYRFDDPDGEVGAETHLLRSADGRVLQIPVTYRGSPLLGADPYLIGLTEHSVLGRRWVYDACGDPVYARALATALLTGGSEAGLDVVEEDGSGTRRREATTRVVGSGSADTPVPAFVSVIASNENLTTIINTGSLVLTVLRSIEEELVVRPTGLDSTWTLTGTWPGQDTPTLLALAQESDQSSTSG